MKSFRSSYSRRDVSLYSLGIGVCCDPLDICSLSYLNEFSPGFRVFPTFGVLPPVAVLESILTPAAIPGFSFDYRNLLHASQSLEVFPKDGEIPVEGELENFPTIVGLEQKKDAAILVLEVSSCLLSGPCLFLNRFTFFIRQAIFSPECQKIAVKGKIGKIQEIPRAPLFVHREKIPITQALLYRLSGDLNPLHSDPDLARSVGFPRPILHGLCTLGLSCRVLLLSAFPGSEMQSISADFSSPVFPGETLVIRAWRSSALQVTFQCEALERGVAVLRHGILTFRSPVLSAL